MSHRYPRLITNSAAATFVNSMHGIRLSPDAPRVAKVALPLLALNSLSLLGAEIYGHLEKIVDRFEDVANKVNGIMIEHL